MKAHLKAIISVLALGGIVSWGFKYFFIDNVVHQAPSTMSSIETMKISGVPNFSGKTFSGEDFSLDQFKGKVVILNFWASWCTPCVEEVPSLIKLAQNFHGEVKVIAISGDSNNEDIAAFLKSFPELHGEHIKVITDFDHSRMKIFDVARLPETFILDKNLKLVKKISGAMDWYNKDSIDYLTSLLK